MPITRRDFLITTSATVACSLLPLPAQGATSFAERFRAGKFSIVPSDPTDAGIADVKLSRKWHGEFCTTRLVNHGRRAVRITEVVLSSVQHGFPAGTPLYGESFQMLSQTAGTIGKPVDLGYSETKHYKVLQPEGVTAFSGIITLSPENGEHLVLAFTSCKKFIGRFYLRDGSLEAVIDTEGLALKPGESWQFEELMLLQGARRQDLLNKVADRINRNHPNRQFSPVPTGWCSWYCFGPRVTAQQVLDNLDVIAKNIPSLKYIQIDDGYQPEMGDWLETGKAFGGDVRSVLKEIRRRGFEPAIWVAPFVAETNSHIFQNHPEWFIQGNDAKPLPSNQVTFGGWRHGPWYALDGTHPEVQKHLQEVFQTMREEWGCTYFKLDANFWGAMHGGKFHDPSATRIEAYRRGMEAIRHGAGNGFILGCNHPIWPSFGLIDGSRSSGDIKRTWPTFAKQARQTLNRNWQNGRLWWNDPDAALLTGDLPDNEFQFHATAIYASGGMVLSGDDLTKISPARLTMLRKLLPPTGVAAEFESDSLNVGYSKFPEKCVISVFNWNDQPQTVDVALPKKTAAIVDFWTDETLGKREGKLIVKDMPPHSARLLVCT